MIVFVDIMYKPSIFDFPVVCPGCPGHRQPEGHADAVQRNPILVEKGQTRLCRCLEFTTKTKMYCVQSVA